jgi:hypothetical protein
VIKVLSIGNNDDTANRDMKYLDEDGFTLIAIVPVVGSANYGGSLRTFWTDTPMLSDIQVAASTAELKTIES